MNELDRLRRLAVVSGGLGLVIGALAVVQFVIAFHGDPEAAFFGTPSAILGGDPASAVWLRRAAFGYMLFPYLLLTPFALFLHRRLRANGPWLADLSVVGGLAFIFVGACGAAILAVAGPSLVEAYAAASGAEQRADIATAFDLLRNVVFLGLWQVLESITLGTWILTTGMLLVRERRFLSSVLVVLGVAVLASGSLTMLGVRSLTVILVWFAVAATIGIAWGFWRHIKSAESGNSP
ncbi:MAG: hypothetical protein ACR2H0_02220 [Candidatus Limnocylindrales bacterium]